MKVLLFGANGQVGWELRRSLAPLGELIPLSRADRDPVGDLADLDGIARTIRTIAPDVIVNAAAYTAVDQAETDKAAARLINTDAVRVVAEQAARLGSLLIHYSTDYVFDGEGSTPFKEDHPTAPLNEYGRTKRDGEEAIIASGCKAAILRTSWVYAARGRNFLKTILRLAQSREKLDVVADQFGAPTGAELIADVTSRVIPAAVASPEKLGTYHLTASGETSWHGYASFIVDTARQLGVPLRVEKLNPICSDAFPTPAARPRNSRLDCGKITNAFAVRLPDWRLGVSRVIEELREMEK